MTAPPRPYRVYCVSSGRPGNVPPMTAALAPDPITWVVPHAERHDYLAAGAQTRLLVHPPIHADEHQLPVQRQAALDDATAQGLVCIQTDDDLRSFKRVVPLPSRRATTAPATWPEVRDAMLAALDGTVHLVGLPPTDNAMFALRSKPHNGLVNAHLTACDTATPRWDAHLPLKEDYDFTCQHMATYGAVTRLTEFIASYHARTNRGGCQGHRTPATEQLCAQTVLTRWPQYLAPHRTRQHEVQFRPVKESG